MKRKLLLITDGFPFGESERGFIGEEFNFLSREFDVYILAPENKERILYPTDGISGIYRYDFSSFRTTGNARTLFRIMDAATVKEVFRRLTQKGLSRFLSDCKEIALYRYHAWEAEQKIRSIIESKKIDMIYTYWCKEYTLAAAFLKKSFPNLKVITRFHGYDLYEERSKIGWQPFQAEIAARADRLIFACEAALRYFINRWGTTYGSKMDVRYLGSRETQRLPCKTADTLCLVSCSNMIPLKRIGLIVNGLAQLPEGVKVTWNHFGDGSERAAIEALANDRLSSRKDIRWKFWGHVPNSELKGIYREIAPDLFITISSTEGGTPVSIQEVAAMGIPAIGTPVGGIPEAVVEGETGYLLSDNPEPQEIADAILKFWSLSEAQRASMSDAARNLWQQKFDAQKNARQFVSFLTELLLK